MKKLLLLSALCLGAFAAKADYSDYFRAYYEGQEIANGSTITCSHHEESWGYYIYDANVNFINEIDSEIPCYVTVEYTGTPSQEQVDQEILDENDEIYYWGLFQVCYGYLNGNSISGGSCTNPPVAAMLPANDVKNYYWQAHLNFCDPAVTSSYTMVVTPCLGDGVQPGEYEPIDEDAFRVTVVFTPEEAGIDGIEVDNQAPVYYNLQGVRVANPENGLYIVKRGDKVTKQLIRK